MGSQPVSVDEEVKDRLDSFCDAAAANRSQIASDLLELYLDKAEETGLRHDVLMEKLEECEM